MRVLGCGNTALTATALKSDVLRLNSEVARRDAISTSRA